MTACVSVSWATNPWQWIDDAGRTTYSDQPPSPSGPPVRIIRRPGEAAPPPTLGAEPARPPAASPTPSQAPSQAPSPAPSPAPRASATRAPAPAPESANNDRLRALQESNSRLRAAHCAQVSGAWATLESGQRISRTLPNGEREVLDDAARATERARLQGILASDCPSV